ncbi:SusC/RagA family TonB-linked outer membrane protein [Flavobacterium sp. WLB]|uniref:SusC/RagA family TonB-linked outer membrane protein n=1 Tax=Flavobacterium sp. WLB TaxID=2161662 RepID=UPI000D38D792|nr:SusC/RagA family TonB-linked outer membrane protein [Flavobacterium sp. WLB]PUU69908.1 SusC/RagA family TonB-linked outer membrane protein [Flavobacterium sp. WLB]
MNNFSFSKDGKDVYCLFFLGFLLSFSQILANNHSRQGNPLSQQHKVQGTVTDGTNPLPGVTIVIKNKKNNAVISDYSGQFSLTCSPSDTLVVSYIGFKNAHVPIQGRSVVNIVLSYDTTTLQEVRVNAGYYSVKESERTGNIARITSKDIETQPVTNVLAAMQGRMAGVNIVQQTGIPGGGFDIRIRGQNSIRTDANAPLYIIDGVPYASDPIGSYQTATAFPSVASPLNNINTENIESIEVLKDADATSIYGSKGANGVVLITTKKGKRGKTTFTVNASTGAATATRYIKLMNTQQYLAMRRQAFINDGLTQYGEADYDVNGTWDQNRYTDWQRELIGGTAQISDIQATISGGSDNTQFLVSGNSHRESTVFPGDFLYKKAGSQLSLNHRSVDNKFKLTFSGSYNIQDNNQPSFDFTYDARTLPPNAPALYDAAGQLNWENETWQNPLANLNTKFESKTNDLLANTVISYEIWPDFTIKSSLGYTDLNTKETRIVPSTISNPIYNVSSATSAIYLNNTQRNSWIIEPQINWVKEVGGGKLDALLGSTFQNQSTEKLYLSATGFTSNSLIYNIAAAKTVKIVLNDESLYKYQAFFGRLNYNWQQKYIVNLTARRDGSSRFGPGNQFANFGAAGIAWVFSNESFLKKYSWLSFGKIRSSYGTTGSDQIGDYQFLDTYTVSNAIYAGNTGLQPTRLYNADFGWEINKKLEVALEMGFLHDRIFLTGAWYQNRSSNQLVGIPLPGSTGFTVIQSNLDATVENTGLELTMRTLNFNKGSFNWSTSVNVTFEHNTLLKFPGLEGSSYSQQYRIGQPLNIELLYSFNGVNPQNGVYSFEDINKDGKISFPDDQQIIADLNPKYYGGIQNQLSYKGLSLDFLFQFVKQKNYSYPMGSAGMMSNQQTRMTDSWISAEDPGLYQFYTTGSNGNALTGYNLFSQSTASIVDASYIRLKNIALSYELPLNLKETKCKIMLQGQNLLTFTKYEDGDPEFKSYGFLPPLKIITAGVQLTF